MVYNIKVLGGVCLACVQQGRKLSGWPRLEGHTDLASISGNLPQNCLQKTENSKDVLMLLQDRMECKTPPNHLKVPILV